MKKINLLLLLLSITTILSCRNESNENESSVSTNRLIGKWKLESIISADNVVLHNSCDLKYGGLNILNKNELIEETGKITPNQICESNNYESTYNYENNILHVINKNSSFEFKYKIVELDHKLIGKLIWSKEVGPNNQTYITETDEKQAEKYTYIKK